MFISQHPNISIIIILFLFLFYADLYPQNHQLYDDIVHISHYICSSKMTSLNKEPSRWIDSLFNYTMRFKNNDISETLFLLTFVTLQYKEMPLKIPIIEKEIFMPLPHPHDSLFHAKNKAMPKLFFYFSSVNENDRDKYSHFFGNAFLSFNIDLFNLSKFMGIFVEYFEDTFKVEGAVDIKDIYTNFLGEKFGRNISENLHILPSKVISSIDILFYMQL